MLSKLATFILILMPFHWLLAQDYELTGGAYHTVAVCPNGDVAAWGRNNYGQIGDGTNNNRTKPVAVKGLSNVRQVVSKTKFNLALKVDGTVWAWGNNKYGQLGDGTRQNRNEPVKVKNLDDIKEIKISQYSGYALEKDGTLWGWGRNDGRYILGDGTAQTRTTPVKITNNVKDFMPGVYLTVALKDNGSVWTWGRNDVGQLGNGTNTKSLSPVKVNGLNNVKAIDTKPDYFSYCFALGKQGKLWAWGWNDCGQLGNGTTINRNEPVRIKNLPSIKSIDAKDANTYLFSKDGDVWFWGCGNLGTANQQAKNKPFEVPRLSNALYFSITGFSTLFETLDGKIKGWGGNSKGQLGNGTTDQVNFKNGFSTVQGLRDPDTIFSAFTLFASGHVIALKNGKLYGWGQNDYGQLGLGDTTQRLTPKKLKGFFPTIPKSKIRGPRFSRKGLNETYRVENPGAEEYHWTVPDDWEIKQGQGDSLIKVLTGEQSGKVCVSAVGACGSGKTVCQKVRIGLNIGPDTTICKGDSVVLAPLVLPSEGVQWSTGATSDSIVVSKAGTYHVTISSDSATLSDTIRVQTAPRPHVYVGPDKAFCGQVDYLIEPEVKAAQTYRWNTGDTTKTLYVDQEGQYWLRVESEESCSNADTTELKEIAYPESFDSSQITACRERVKLDAGNPGASYQWNTGDTSRILTVNTDGRYAVEIANAYCTIKDTVQVEVDKEAVCPKLFVPNAFSPNGDGLNEVFKPEGQKILDYEMTIYNRWGQRIYHSKALDQGWDGMVDGKQAQTGAYLYHITYKFEKNGVTRLKTKEGTVRLVK